MKTNLTENEKTLLGFAQTSSKGNGHDFGYTEDIVFSAKGRGLTAKQAGGVITSLQAKGIISVESPVTTDTGTWTQFILAEEYRDFHPTAPGNWHNAETIRANSN